MPRDQAPAASTTMSAAAIGAVLERDALRAAALHDNLLHRPLLVDGDAGGLGRHHAAPATSLRLST